MGSRVRAAAIFGLLLPALAGLSVSATIAAAAGGNHITIHARKRMKVGSCPTPSKCHPVYRYSVTGHAAAAGDRLVTFIDVTRCSRNYKSELRKHLGRGVRAKVRIRFAGKFKAKFELTPEAAGKAHICGYLIRTRSGKTFARAVHTYHAHR